MARICGAICVSLLSALAGCVSPEAHLELKAANDDMQRQLADLGRYHTELESENQRLRDEVSRLGENVAEADFVRNQKAELTRLIDEFQTGGTRAIPGIKVIETSEGVAFSVQGEVLFASGQAVLTNDGKQALGSLMPTLREHGRDLRIDGHTDNDPIKHSPWKTNLRLSSERSMAVVEFLTKNGLAADRCFIAAYGEHRPAVSGLGPETKRQNRRVEILMLRD